ncbi:MAG: Cpe/LpqF family protein [Thermomicrobiales bacterium]
MSGRLRVFACVMPLISQMVMSRVQGVAQTPPASVPDTPLSDQLRWVVDTLNSGAGDLTLEQAQNHFASSFLERVPAKYLIENLQQIATKNAPFTIIDIDGADTDPYSVAAVTAGNGLHFAITIAVEQGPPNKILPLVSPIPPNVPLHQPESHQAADMLANTWSQWDKFWSSKAEHASFLAAELTGDVCIPVHALAPDDELAVDSLSKLIVLAP